MTMSRPDRVVLTSTSTSPSSFRFQKMWCKHPDFIKVVEDRWVLPVHLTGMLRLKEKLFCLKQRLRQWNKSVFGDILQHLLAAEETVKATELQYDSYLSDENLIALNRQTVELQHTLAVEEDYWTQKSAYKWEVDGERNSHYHLSRKSEPEHPLRLYNMRGVDWDFLQAMLVQLDFPPLWLRFIANCTQHSWFSIMVNGGLSGFFKFSRGLRSLGFVGCYRVSNLAYVDDVLIFTNSNEYNLTRVKDFLDDFTTTIDNA
ncbi:hypothetical protein Sango_2303400 [Sesamum angolense]|uniref:Reverse transcriptase n=1 Tax=Sesamum angolense TaxID=2727404 RepID=A0AAE1WA88_9LAMI|nr:hypothetical protein Sango_2303400 [Sesamum angolense]